LDANGNYNLNSVGFDQVNKLNLPDLKSSAATTDVAKTTKKATEDTIKAQTTEVFKPSNVYQSGGDGQGASTSSMVKDAKVNEATVRQAGDRQRLDPRDTRSTSDIQNLKDAQATYRSTAPNLTSAPGYGTSFSGTGQDLIDRKAANETIMDARQNYGATTQFNTPKTTGLQKVQSAVQNTVGNVIDSVKNNKALQMAGTVLGVLKGGVGLAGNLLSKIVPRDNLNDMHARKYFNRDPDESGGRISGNPATDLYAGMNVVSYNPITGRRGNLEAAGKKRISKREATIAKRAAAGNPVSDSFITNTNKMKDQQNDYKTAKTETQKATQGPAGGATTGGGNGGNNNSGKSIVCTAMYQTTGLEDWSKAMKIWYIYQKKYLTIQHQEGYHKLFKPFVKGMHKSNIIKAIGAHVAKHRTQHLKHIMFNSKPSLLGKVYNKILEPICYWIGKI